MFSNRENFLNMSQFNEFLSKFNKNHEEEKKRNTWMWVGIIIGAVALIAGVSYAIYRYLTPNYLEDFDEDFDLDFEDDDYDDIDYDDDDLEDIKGEEIAETMMENEVSKE
ncbi:MAG: DUF4366 domain-containing protein [Eubacteriales bacterium]